MVSVYVPGGVETLVVTVIVEVPLVVIVDGSNDAEAPAGKPSALNVTVPLNPPDGVTVTVKVVLFPCSTVCDAGAAEMPKSGPPGQLANLKAPINVFQLYAPFAERYSL